MQQFQLELPQFARLVQPGKKYGLLEQITALAREYRQRFTDSSRFEAAYSGRSD